MKKQFGRGLQEWICWMSFYCFYLVLESLLVVVLHSVTAGEGKEFVTNTVWFLTGSRRLWTNSPYFCTQAVAIENSSIVTSIDLLPWSTLKFRLLKSSAILEAFAALFYRPYFSLHSKRDLRKTLLRKKEFQTMLEVRPGLQSIGFRITPWKENSQRRR